jgi:hypothetical protein
MNSAPAPSVTRVIPATMRHDGSMRKEVKIRPGFRSEELHETGTYKSTGTKVKEQRDIYRNYIPGMPTQEEVKKPTRAEKRKAKKAAAKQNDSGDAEVIDLTGDVSSLSLLDSGSKQAPHKATSTAGRSGGVNKPTDSASKPESKAAPAPVPAATPAVPIEEMDPAKLHRKLKKKLRQIHELRQSIESGQRAATAEEGTKLAQEPALAAEIAQLETTHPNLRE